MNEKQQINQTSKVEKEKLPNEQIGFHFSSSIKIFDPETKEVLVQMRCD